MSFLNVGQFGAANTLFQRASTLNPNHNDVKSFIEILSVLNKNGWGNIDQTSVATYLELKKRYPKSIYLDMVGGRVYRINSLIDESNSILEASVASVPEIPHVWYELGMTRARMGKTRSAIDAFETAVDLGESSKYYYALGKQYFTIAEWNSSAANFNRSLELDEENLIAKVDYIRSKLFACQFEEAKDNSKELHEHLLENSKPVENIFEERKLYVQPATRGLPWVQLKDPDELHLYVRGLLKASDAALQNNGTSFSANYDIHSAQIKKLLKIDLQVLNESIFTCG